MAIRRDTTSIRFAQPITPLEMPQEPWGQEMPPDFDPRALEADYMPMDPAEYLPMDPDDIFAMRPEPYEPYPTDDIVGLDGLTRTRKELNALRSMRGRLDKEHAGSARESRRGFGLGPYSDRFE